MVTIILEWRKYASQIKKLNHLGEIALKKNTWCVLLASTCQQNDCVVVLLCGMACGWRECSPMLCGRACAVRCSMYDLYGVCCMARLMLRDTA